MGAVVQQYADALNHQLNYSSGGVMQDVALCSGCGTGESQSISEDLQLPFPLLCTMFVEPTTYIHAPTAAHHVNTCRNSMRDATDARASVLHSHANNARVDLHLHHSGARHELATSLYLAGGPNASQW